MKKPIKIKLKRKYRTRKETSGGKPPTRTNSKSPKLGLAARMENPLAIDLYYMDCAFKNYWEQIPTLKHAVYEKRIKEFNIKKSKGLDLS